MTSTTASSSQPASPTGAAPRTEKLSPIVLAALSGPNISLAALSLPLVIYLPEYYSGPLGLNLSLVGAIFMIVRLADIGFDPLIGAMMDRSKLQSMRYRIWMVAGAPLIMAGMGMLFMAKPGDNVGALYLGGWLVVAYAGWSIVSLAQLALAANISPDYNERSRIYSWLQVAFMIGLLGVMLLPKYLIKGSQGSAASSMSSMAWVVIAITPVLVAITAFIVRERPTATGGAHSNSGLLEYLKLFKRKIVRRLILVELFFGLASGMASTLLMFFFTRAKGIDRADIGVILITHFVMALIGTPIWTAIAQRIGKHKALALAGVIYFLAQSTMIFVPEGGLVYAAIIAGTTGTVLGAVTMLPRAMLADVADEEQLTVGEDRTGLLFAILIGTWKIGQALSVGVMFVVLDMIGFDATPGAENAASSMGGLIVLYAMAPALLSLLGSIFIWSHPLTEDKHAEIRAKLDARNAAKTPHIADIIESPEASSP